MPQRTQQSTTANQGRHHLRRRGPYLAGLHNCKVCRGLKLQERARETHLFKYGVSRAVGTREGRGEDGREPNAQRTTCGSADLRPACRREPQPRMFSSVREGMCGTWGRFPEAVWFILQNATLKPQGCSTFKLS